MSPVMLKKLQRNLEYHAAMAERYQDLHDADVDEGKVKDDDEPSTNQKLAELHGQVVEQLRPIVEAGEKPNMVEQLLLNQPVMRNLSGDLKPSAGRFH